MFPGGDFEWVANRDFQLQTNTPELARLKSGFLIREILDRFSQKMKSQLNPDRSLWLYSAHDTTVANILNALGLFEVMTRTIFYRSIYCLFSHGVKKGNKGF